MRGKPGQGGNPLGNYVPFDQFRASRGTEQSASYGAQQSSYEAKSSTYAAASSSAYRWGDVSWMSLYPVCPDMTQLYRETF